MIISVPCGCLNERQKQEIENKGHVLIECDTPELVRVINPELSFESNDLFMAALKALTTLSPSCKAEYFVNNLHKSLSARDTQQILNSKK